MYDKNNDTYTNPNGAEQVPDEPEFGTAPNQQVHNHVKINLPVTKKVIFK